MTIKKSNIGFEIVIVLKRHIDICLGFIQKRRMTKTPLLRKLNMLSMKVVD